MTPIKQAKHYFSQFHPTYVGADKAAALAKEAGFENWVQHFSDLNNAWSELPKFNTERPMLTAYRLAEGRHRPGALGAQPLLLEDRRRG